MAAVNHRLPDLSTIIYRFRSTILDMIGDRLKELRQAAGMDQVQFAAVAGTSKQYVSQLERGRNKDPNPKFIERWASHFGVRMEWITTGRGAKTGAPPPPAQAANEDDWLDVTGYAQAAGLGTGPEASEWAETHKLKFRRDSLSKKRLSAKNLAVMYGSGDSMEPTIEQGDAILFDTSDTSPKNRGVYVLLVPGAGAEEYSVKRASVTKNGTFFIADNPDGDHGWKEPRPASGVKIVGRVRWTGGWVK